MSRAAVPVGIGIVGCGYISAAHLTAARCFPILDVRAVADLDTAAAQTRATICGAFRSATHYQFGCGGQFVAHPGGIVDFTINVTAPDDEIMRGIEDFE